MAPIAARQSELCRESREITIHRTAGSYICVYSIYSIVCVHMRALAGFYNVCSCMSTLRVVTLMMMDDVV